jgi:hypothetical protein
MDTPKAKSFGPDPLSGVGIVYKNTFQVILSIALYMIIIFSDWYANQADSFEKMSLIFTLGHVLILLPAIQPLIHEKNSD